MTWRGYILGLAIALCVASAVLFGAYLYTVRTTNIAVIRVSGSIADFTYGDQAYAALRDPNVKGVLVVIDSPGGWLEPCIETEAAFRKLNQAKPVVISMGQYAASGAYLVSTASDYIFARHGTITAGLGVRVVWVSRENYYLEEGIKYFEWTTGELKSLGAEYRSPTPEESAFIQSWIENVLDGIIERILLNRPQVERIDELKDGLTRDGVDALTYHLVDELGDYYDALRKAEELTGLKRDEYTVVEF